MTRDSTSYTYTYDNNDKLTAVSGGGQSASLSYDSNGNMTGVSGSLFPNWTLVYDDENRLTSVTYPWGEGTSTDEYEYNALGQAMEYLPNGSARQAWVYDGDRLLEYRYASSGGIKGRYTNESGSYYQPWQSVNTSTRARFPLYDGVGSVPRLVDETGTLKYYQTLDAFGVPRTAGYGGDSPCNYERYCGAWGYLTSYTSGLTKVGARFYWPEVGRFVQQDPIGDGVNWYAYVDGNPVAWVDPTGECLDWIDDMDWGDAFDFADWKKKEVRFWGCMVRRQLGDDIVGLLKSGAKKIGWSVGPKAVEGHGYWARHNAQRMNDIWERGKAKPRQTPGRIKKLQNLRTRALWLGKYGDDLVRVGKFAGKASLAVTAGTLVYDYGKCFGNLQ